MHIYASLKKKMWEIPRQFIIRTHYIYQRKTDNPMGKCETQQKVQINPQHTSQKTTNSAIRKPQLIRVNSVAPEG